MRPGERSSAVFMVLAISAAIVVTWLEHAVMPCCFPHFH